jgi:anoctamin-1
MFGFLNYNEAVFPTRQKTFTAVYSRDKEYLFKISDDMFIPSRRITIVDFILKRMAFCRVESSGRREIDSDVGIEKLLNDGVYDAAFPPHEGDVNVSGSPRYNLKKYWGSLWMFYKNQPLDHIREYFGVKIGLYFAWLGYYTFMLVPASIVGLFCFIYGWATLQTDPISQDVCDPKLNETMCPLCDHRCPYWYLNEICLHAKITYLVDNPSTLFFAVFMSFWCEYCLR